jgi:hypothetical protein
MSRSVSQHRAVSTEYSVCYHEWVVLNVKLALLHRCADEMVDGKWNKFRDDVTHDGKRIDWGKWAITGDDSAFGGTGNPDTGAQAGAWSKLFVCWLGGCLLPRCLCRTGALCCSPLDRTLKIARRGRGGTGQCA